MKYQNKFESYFVFITRDFQVGVGIWSQVAEQINY